MQRSAVLFPDPLRPIRVNHIAFLDSKRQVVENLQGAIRFSDILKAYDRIHELLSDSSRAFQASLELAAQKRHWVADYEVNTGSYREHKERSERGVIDDLRRVGKIGESDDHRVGGVFYDLHKKTYRRGDRDTYGLREDDINEALHRRESEALAGLPLCARDCLNAALPDFTKIGA